MPLQENSGSGKHRVPTPDDGFRLLPVALPSSASEREAAEFAEGLKIVDALVARLRAQSGEAEAPGRKAP